MIRGGHCVERNLALFFILNLVVPACGPNTSRQSNLSSKNIVEAIATTGPVTVDSSGHTLLRGGAPFQIRGESSWLLVPQLTLSEADSYFNDRVARGFNTVLVMAFNHDYESQTGAPSGTAPRTRAGLWPFVRNVD